MEKANKYEKMKPSATTPPMPAVNPATTRALADQIGHQSTRMAMHQPGNTYSQEWAVEHNITQEEQTPFWDAKQLGHHHHRSQIFRESLTPYLKHVSNIICTI
jgi:hypothetical protein